MAWSVNNLRGSERSQTDANDFFITGRANVTAGTACYPHRTRDTLENVPQMRDETYLSYVAWGSKMLTISYSLTSPNNQLHIKKQFPVSAKFVDSTPDLNRPVYKNQL